MIVLVGVALTWMFYQLFYTLGDRIKFFTKKPFSCQFCLSLWVTIGFFYTTGQYPAWCIPITYEIVRLIIKRL